jgi:hypothetical protein
MNQFKNKCTKYEISFTYYKISNLDSQTRKRLPTWILEGLEKAEKEK